VETDAFVFRAVRQKPEEFMLRIHMLVEQKFKAEYCGYLSTTAIDQPHVAKKYQEEAERQFTLYYNVFRDIDK
jgi:hypothetical protein